jgi:hypothetical protein
MTPEQLNTALDDIAMAVEMCFDSIQQRNERIVEALNEHFPSLLPSNVEI